MSVNRAILVGNIGKDAETYTPNGGDRTSCKFTLATSERYRTHTGELKEETTWHNIVYWIRSDSGLPGYLRKGTLVYVEGSIVNRQYTTQSGETKYITEIKANHVELVGGKPQNQPSAQQGPYQSNGMPGGNYQPQQYGRAPQNNPQGFQQTGQFPQKPLYEQAKQMGQPAQQPGYNMPAGFEDLPDGF